MTQNSAMISRLREPRKRQRDRTSESTVTDPKTQNPSGFELWLEWIEGIKLRTNLHTVGLGCLRLLASGHCFCFVTFYGTPKTSHYGVLGLHALATNLD